MERQRVLHKRHYDRGQKLSKQLLDSTQDIIFRTIHNRCLIYNACWEDPRIDRQLLKVDSASKVVVITSAGCNTLVRTGQTANDSCGGR